MTQRHRDRESGNLLIRGGRIVDPSQRVDSIGDLLISEGRVSRLSPPGAISAPRDCLVLRAEGMVVCPGFIDLHCHLRQPGFEEKETIATGTRAAARGGFTTVCCMPNTEPPIDSRPTLEYVKSVAAREGAVRVLPVGCVTKGRAGKELADFGELAESGAVAFSDDGSPVFAPELMREALKYSSESGLPVIDHCEDLALSRDGVMNDGEISTRLELKGIPAAAEANMVRRDIDLAKSTGGRLHIAHVSAAESVHLIRRSKKRGVRVTAEVTPHHLILDEHFVLDYDTNAKVKPPLMTEEDIAVLRRALKEGIIDAVATDHAPHTAADKDCDFQQAAFGISGFETALGSLMDLVFEGEIELSTLIYRMTRGPALVLGRADIGTLGPDSCGDVVVFDPEVRWVVNPDDFISKGKNTPLAGLGLRGKVMATVVGGAVVYSDDTLTLNRMNVKC